MKIVFFTTKVGSLVKTGENIEEMVGYGNRGRSNIISLYFGGLRPPPPITHQSHVSVHPPPILVHENSRRDRICVIFCVFLCIFSIFLGKNDILNVTIFSHKWV